jgi:hypothetical protein
MLKDIGAAVSGGAGETAGAAWGSNGVPVLRGAGHP